MDNYKFKLGLAIAREEELKKKLDALTTYDEAKERELFEDWIPSFWNKRKHLDEDGDWIYADDLTQGALIGWLECAKSRARSAE